RRNGIFRTKLYVAIVLSWITLILYLPSFFNQAEAGSPRFWLPKSSISDFIHLLIVTAPALPLLALVSSIVLLSAVYVLYRHRDYKALLQTQNPRVNSEKYLLIIAFTFLVVPLVVFAISYIKPLFLDRYLIPTTFVWAIVIAAITQRMMVPSSVESCSAS